MHEMQTIVIDIDVLDVCLSVCLSCGLTRLRCAKTAERIKMLFGVNILASWGQKQKLCKRQSQGGPERSHVSYWNFWYLVHILGTATASASCACSVCGAFNAAFAKLLWFLV